MERGLPLPQKTDIMIKEMHFQNVDQWVHVLYNKFCVHVYNVMNYIAPPPR